MLLKYLPILGTALKLVFLAFAAFIRLILASILPVLGAFDPINFPDPVFCTPGPPTCPRKLIRNN